MPLQTAIAGLTRAELAVFLALFLALFLARSSLCAEWFNATRFSFSIIFSREVVLRVGPSDALVLSEQA